MYLQTSLVLALIHAQDLREFHLLPFCVGCIVHTFCTCTCIIYYTRLSLGLVATFCTCTCMLLRTGLSLGFLATFCTCICILKCIGLSLGLHVVAKFCTCTCISTRS